ncbi:N-acetyltransferase [Deinococcus malanensis]|uniref:N-acetyltransferase n=1 Tax=Deinococcus malanensis TaxID=1706855 RepID=A0ABQ2F486_9DEIO|nr:GNAT family N-acetyltransferase [Deinococcus malanensis]GGK39371.1 N-acetyltransferase [Deinococcus malanensis]
MPLSIRAYRPEDRAACLAIFDANMPMSFLPPERPAFGAWLDSEDGAAEYLVVEDASGIVACGGLWFSQDVQRPAGFAWGMVHPDRQRQGIGAQLARVRLSRLRELGVPLAALDTSQWTAPFYARLGFREVRRTPDGYGPGLDRVDMTLDLTDEAQEE